MELKKPATFDEQIRILADVHHMKIRNLDEAKRFLSFSNYYRFTGYAIPFRKDRSGDTFCPNTDFDAVKSIYEFDEELRNLLHIYLEKVEIFARTQISYWFSIQRNTDPPYMAHYDENQFKDRIRIRKIYNCLNKEKDRNKNHPVVVHHQIKYGDKMPLWVIVELLSFSNVSILYSCMKDSEQELIADGMHTGPSILQNHLYCLSQLRNKCAHYDRLYGKDMVFYPPAVFPQVFLKHNPQILNYSLFAYILVLKQRQPTYKDKCDLTSSLISLIEKYKDYISIDQLGAPDKYDEVLKSFL